MGSIFTITTHHHAQEQSIYAAHPTYSSFSAARPRGAPLWKSIANEVAVHKRYKKRRDIIVSAADAYSNLRSIALAKPISCPASAGPPAEGVDASSTTLPALNSSPPALATAAVLPFDALSVVVDVALSSTVADSSQPAAPASPLPISPSIRPTTPRSPSTPPTPAHDPCCVCRCQSAVVVILPCRDQRMCAECWTSYLAAKEAVHGGKERLRRKLHSGNFVAAPFVPVCPHMWPGSGIVVCAVHQLAQRLCADDFVVVHIAVKHGSTPSLLPLLMSIATFNRCGHISRRCSKLVDGSLQKKA